MHAMLLIAHGSRRTDSNQEVRDLANQLAEGNATKFGCVIPAFLELAEPDIPTGVDLCVAAGADEVTVVPYFLSAGRHVVDDIPHEIARARGNHPDLKVKLCKHIGQHPDMMKLLMNAATGLVEEID